MSSRRPTLLHAMEHHARDKRDVIHAITLVYATMLAPNGWRIANLRGGANSWMIYDEKHPNRQWHFRNGGKGAVQVRDSYYRNVARKKLFLTSRLDVIRWAEAL